MDVILLITLGLVFGILASHTFEFTLKKNKILNQRYYRHHEIIFGYHIHHSSYGLLCIILGCALLLAGQVELMIFLCATGTGIVIMHTLFDGRFIFIEKKSHDRPSL